MIKLEELMSASALTLGGEKHAEYVRLANAMLGEEPVPPPGADAALRLGKAMAGLSSIAEVTSLDPTSDEGMAFINNQVEWAISSKRWFELGRPTFNLVPDFFRSCLVTDFGEAETDPVKLPFDVFLLRLPPEAKLRLPEDEEAEEAMGARAMDMPKMPPAMFVHSYHLWRGVGAAPELISKAGEPFKITPTSENMWFLPSFIAPFRNKRASWFPTDTMRDLFKTDYQRAEDFKRVLGNTLLYINMSGGLPKTKCLGESVPVEREHHTEPRFRVGRPIKLSRELRLAIDNGLAGRTWKLSARFIVRGHWRNQVHGPQRSLRRRQWIQPFWKGPENVTEALTRTFVVE